MTEIEQVKQVLQSYEEAGLIERNLGKVLNLISDSIIGIGIGEQGFVTSKDEISEVFTSGLKEAEDVSHELKFDRIEVRIPVERMAVVCADVVVTASSPDRVISSRFSQSLTLVKEKGEWKICCLHASAPVVTEENVEAYPLRFAEKTLASLREKIGEEVYMAEEQYRKAILQDTLASYIINFTTDTVEKCQLNGNLCVSVEPGSPCERTIRELISEYVMEEDREQYLRYFSRDNIFQAFDNHENEVQYEYRMKPAGSDCYIWVVSIIRLITDIVTGEKKGIMYVKNIDAAKRQKLAMQEKAEFDEMLHIYNRTAFIERVETYLKRGHGAFLMLDIDNFKGINDSYGHPFGDKALIGMAEALRSAFPAGTILGRFGGDEFGLFLPCICERNQIAAYLDNLFENIAGFLTEDGRKVPVTCSVGVACAMDGDRFCRIYKVADEALYHSKHEGKNRYTFYGFPWCDAKELHKNALESGRY